MRIVPALLILASFAAADTVQLNNGLKVHGSATETGGHVIVRTSDGRTWKFARDKVKTITRGESKREEYARRVAELEEADASAWFKL